jgi:hypothetical protein
MRRWAVCTLLLVMTLTGCDGAPSATPVAPAPPKLVGGLVVYDSDQALTRSDLTETTTLGDFFAILDPNPDKSSLFVKSGYETSAVFEGRIAGITGDQNRYVLVVPARLEYDADSQQASFCPTEPIFADSQCVYGNRRAGSIDLGGWAAGNFSGQWSLDVSANKLKTPLIPLKLTADAMAARRAAEAKSVRLAFVFTLDQPYESRRFAKTEGITLRDTASTARVTLRRVVAYERGGVVLGVRGF